MGRMEVHKDLGKLLLEEGLISASQLGEARATQSRNNRSIGRVLTGMGVISEEAKMAFLNKRFKYEIVDIRDVRIMPGILRRVPYSYAEKHCCVPLFEEGGKLVVAMEDPTDIMVLDGLRAQTGMEILPVVASEEAIMQAVSQYLKTDLATIVRPKDKAAPPAWMRVLHPVLFLFFMMAPFIVFGLLLASNDQFSNMVSKLGQPFDVSLYLILGWALWSIVLWEIDGLIFSSSSKESD